MTSLLAPRYFTDAELGTMDPHLVPQHIAIIPDGNRRWAEQKAQQASEGHESGANSLLDIVYAAKELGVKALTVYTFSTENWRRDDDEINALMWIIETYLREECAAMIENEVRLTTIGDLAPLAHSLKQTIEEVKYASASCDKITLNLALNYGSRDEICRAVHAILDAHAAGEISKEDVTEKFFSKQLDTNGMCDPELFIRTSGEMRISNFLLWQLSYAEVYVCPTLWPDFQPSHLFEAVSTYQKRNRRLGT